MCWPFVDVWLEDPPKEKKKEEEKKVHIMVEDNAIFYPVGHTFVILHFHSTSTINTFTNLIGPSPQPLFYASQGSHTQLSSHPTIHQTKA